jgi:hypothetical protein
MGMGMSVSECASKSSECVRHLEDMLLPEEWLQLDYAYLTTPPSLDTQEFRDILKVQYIKLCMCVYVCVCEGEGEGEGEGVCVV